MFNLNASLFPLANKTLIQNLMPGVDAEALQICLVLNFVLNPAMLGLFLNLSPNPLPFAQIPYIVMIQVTLSICSVSLCSCLRYTINWLWCPGGYEGECGAFSDCLLKKIQEKTNNTRERNDECLCINMEKSNGLGL